MMAPLPPPLASSAGSAAERALAAAVESGGGFQTCDSLAACFFTAKSAAWWSVLRSEPAPRNLKPRRAYAGPAAASPSSTPGVLPAFLHSATNVLSASSSAAAGSM